MIALIENFMGKESKKNCLICYKEFIDRSRNHAKVTCSNKCRTAYYFRDQNKRLDSLVRLRSTVFLSKGFLLLDENKAEIKEKLKQGLCDICGKRFSVSELNIDHCHATKTYRGVLCGNCNRLLGMANDNVETLKNCIVYLAKNSYRKQK